MVPKVALALFHATCSETTSKDLEGLSREPGAHVWGVLSAQRALQGHGPGVHRTLLEES